MSEEETTAEEAQEEEEDAIEDSGEGSDAKDEPPKKRAKKASKPKKEKDDKDGKAKKKKKPRKHPKTIEMVVEAIDNMNEKQGSSVQAIKSYILQNFKTVRPDMVKTMLRRALAQGMKSNVLSRPKGQADTQPMSGRYLLGKSNLAEEDEVMPQQSKRAKEAQLMKAKGKKGKKKKRKSTGGARRPVAKKASPKKRR